jgi:hypothetical protein
MVSADRRFGTAPPSGALAGTVFLSAFSFAAWRFVVLVMGGTIRFFVIPRLSLM